VRVVRSYGCVDTSFARAGGGPGVARRASLTLLTAAVLAALAAAAYLGASASADAHRRAVDERLAEVARAATLAFDREVAGLSERAAGVAREPRVARALARSDAATLRSVSAMEQGVSFWKDGTLLAGSRPPADAVTRSADVTFDGAVLGRVSAELRLDGELAGRLARAAAPRPSEGVGVAVAGRLHEASGVRTFDLAPAGRAANAGGERLRVAATPLLRDRRDVLVVAATPAAAVDSEARERRRRVLLAIGATGLTVLAGLAAFLIWRSGRRTELRSARAEADRRHVRDALSLVGDALAATHDAEGLLPVIAQTAMEAAGATEARLMRGETEIVRVGGPSSSRAPLVLPLGADDDGVPLRLLLFSAGGTLSPGARELAEWFVSQAAIALENARLHGVVQRQAITDDLTGLANRRRFVEALEGELSRAERFGSELAVVIGDLDDFKSINDRFGHEFGNDVLRAFGQLVTDSTRDIDVAARLGGEEFAVLLPQTDVDGGAVFAERLRGGLAGLGLEGPDGQPLRVTASFGVAAYPPIDTVDGLLRIADSALYRAKAHGKDRVVAG
jgi:diguanylate cyclase (GGDEF)-like protein